MRIRRSLTWLFGLAVVLAGAQYALQYYGSRVLAQKLEQARDWADIRVGSARFWLWGVVDLDRIRIAPTAPLDKKYGLESGYAVDIGRLRIHGFRFGWDHGPVLVSMAVTARGVRVPVPDWHWAITVARGPNGVRRGSPTLRSMGISRLSFDVQSVLGFTEGYARPQLRLLAQGAGLARIRLHCSLAWPRRGHVLRDPAVLRIRNCRLDYHDLGLMARFETRMAVRDGIRLQELRREISEQIARDAARSRWPLLSTQAMQGFISDPSRILRLQLKPKTPMPFDNVLQPVRPGLPAHLGLTATLVPSSDVVSR